METEGSKNLHGQRKITPAALLSYASNLNHLRKCDLNSDEKIIKQMCTTDDFPRLCEATDAAVARTFRLGRSGTAYRRAGESPDLDTMQPALAPKKK